MSKKPEMERRTVAFDALEVRAGGDNEPPMIMGHAAVFNDAAQIMPGFREQIKPGAFADAIQQDDVRALFNHDPNFVLGRNKAGTLRMTEDKKGLAIEVDPPDTQFARDLMVSMKRGDITQMSFGFRVVDETWDEDKDGNVTRTLNKVSLFDVSPVTYPAYVNTDVAVRSLAEYQEQKTKPEFDAGYLETLKRKTEIAEIS